MGARIQFALLIVAVGLAAACGSKDNSGSNDSNTTASTTGNTTESVQVSDKVGTSCKLNADCNDPNQPCLLLACKASKGKPGVCAPVVKADGSPAYKADKTICDDGNACTTGDVCSNGVCTGSSLDCDDKNQCTTDSCDSKSGCKHEAIAADCNDGNACTKLDTCSNGTCKGVPLDCDDGQACTADSCDSKSGCVHELLENKPCDDGNACTTGDHCKLGFCFSGAGVDCDDKNVCTSDSCNYKKGCVNEPLTGGSCDDGNPNTVSDICVAGTCKGAAKQCSTDEGCKTLEIDQCNAYRCQNNKCVEDWDSSKVIDDNNPCTLDYCDKKSGIVTHTPTGGSCDDGEVCTKNDACVGGACKGTLDNCDDNNACTLDYCLPKVGCQHTANSCDDSSVFTADKCIIDAGSPDKACLHTPLQYSGGCGVPEKFKDAAYAALGFSCRTVIKYLAKDSGGQWQQLAKTSLSSDAGTITMPGSVLCGSFDATVIGATAINVELCNLLDSGCVEIGGQWATLNDPLGGILKAPATTPSDDSDWVMTKSALPLCNAAGK